MEGIAKMLVWDLSVAAERCPKNPSKNYCIFLWFLGLFWEPFGPPKSIKKHTKSERFFHWFFNDFWLQKWSKWEPRGGQERVKKGPKTEAKSGTPKWSEKGTKMEPKRCQNGAKMEPKREQNGVKMEAKSIKDEGKVKPTWIRIKAATSIHF